MFFLSFSTYGKDGKNEKPIDFSQYEIKDSLKIDCEQKRNCFLDCSQMKNFLGNFSNSFGTIKTYEKEECRKKCNLINCNENIKEP
ncbi:hypothetical protein [Leptospira sp. 'Mane']|uniref:hypothetical protein n=1 Tax=Leptospira sp. 'Mane' TaxID=3387407 RepID=UPI00398B086D